MNEGDPPPRTVNIAGRELKVVSDDEAEKADFVVCVLASAAVVFHDNVFATCCVCGVAVQHRPHAPKRPAKICMSCVAEKVAHKAH